MPGHNQRRPQLVAIERETSERFPLPHRQPAGVPDRRTLRRMRRTSPFRTHLWHRRRFLSLGHRPRASRLGLAVLYRRQLCPLSTERCRRLCRRDGTSNFSAGRRYRMLAGLWRVDAMEEHAGSAAPRQPRRHGPGATAVSGPTWPCRPIDHEVIETYRPTEAALKRASCIR
jgi:hypothetical protein